MAAYGIFKEAWSNREDKEKQTKKKKRGRKR